VQKKKRLSHVTREVSELGGRETWGHKMEGLAQHKADPNVQKPEKGGQQREEGKLILLGNGGKGKQRKQHRHRPDAGGEGNKRDTAPRASEKKKGVERDFRGTLEAEEK